VTLALSSPIRLAPDQASDMAGRVDALALFLLGVCGFFLLLILVLIVVFALKYRRRSEDEVPAATVTHRWLEITWMVVPLALLLVMFFWGARLFADMKRPPGPDADALTIHVVGKQWMWKLQHPGGQREINELHLPVGRPVKLVMTSQDVIHSFGLPAMRIKQDVLPGAYSSQWFTPTKVGTFPLYCQEYCGTSHAGMIGRVVVMAGGQYEAWLAGRPADEPPAVAGARLFVSLGCSKCHGQTAPTLAGLFGRQETLEDGSVVVADEAYIRESILNPPAKVVRGFPRWMPSFRGQLSEEQVMDLVAYVKSLGSARDDSPGAAAGRNAAGPATRPVNGVQPQQGQRLPPAMERSNFGNPGVER
jgi:cytochrome c oxidase subunit 2